MSRAAPVKVYLSGPMTGLPEYNKHAFMGCAQALRAVGYEVVNPAENTVDTAGLSEQEAWQAYMRIDIKQLLDCDGIVMMPGWPESKGATLERAIAQGLGLSVNALAEAICEPPRVRAAEQPAKQPAIQPAPEAEDAAHR